MTAPSCKINITPIGQWYLLSSVEVLIPRELKPDRFAKFNYGLDFAGTSRRRICLSVKNSTGPAKIGPYAILEKLPEGFAGLPGQLPGVLLRTNDPRLCFVGIKSSADWDGHFYEQIGIHRDDLADIVAVDNLPDRQPDPTEIPICELTPDIVRLLAQLSNRLHVTFPARRLHIRVPSDLALSDGQWRLLARHIFTDKSVACAQETVPWCAAERYPAVAALTAAQAPGTGLGPPGPSLSLPRGIRLLNNRPYRSLIKLPGISLLQVATRWGVDQQKPSAFDGKNLLFESILVNDATKLSTLYPHVRLLRGRTLRVVEDRMELLSYPLHQTAEAGAVPKRGEIIVDSALEKIFLLPGQLHIARLKCPVQFRQEVVYGRAGLLCPEPLIEKFLLSGVKAARTHRLSKGLKRYEVRTLDEKTKEEIDLEGTYYLKSDLAALPLRDIKTERADRKARLERLTAKYGKDLPENYEKHTDEELGVYFEIRELAARGEILPAAKHPLLPRRHHFDNPFLRWMESVKPDLVLTCPLTGTRYLRAFADIDVLAELPGFWKTVEDILGESSWLRLLFLSSKVRAAALAHSI
jgi:hypothetical protein